MYIIKKIHNLFQQQNNQIIHILSLKEKQDLLTQAREDIHRMMYDYDKTLYNHITLSTIKHSLFINSIYIPSSNNTSFCYLTISYLTKPTSSK